MEPKVLSVRIKISCKVGLLGRFLFRRVFPMGWSSLNTFEEVNYSNAQRLSD